MFTFGCSAHFFGVVTFPFLDDPGKHLTQIFYFSKKIIKKCSLLGAQLTFLIL